MPVQMRVYLGGQMFGARAFAHNFTVDEIKEALDYAHNRGAKKSTLQLIHFLKMMKYTEP